MYTYTWQYKYAHMYLYVCIYSELSFPDFSLLRFQTHSTESDISRFLFACILTPDVETGHFFLNFASFSWNKPYLSASIAKEPQPR